MADFVIGSLVKPRKDSECWSCPTFSYLPDKQFSYYDRSGIGIPLGPYMVLDVSVHFIKILAIKTLEIYWIESREVTCYDDALGVIQ